MNYKDDLDNGPIGLFYIVVVLLFLGMIFTQACMGDVFYSRDLSGQVVEDIESRYVRSEHSSEEKISIVVQPIQADGTIRKVAGGFDGNVIIECTSTRCVQIKKGQCHSFECRHDWRLMEPDVIACKHVRRILCEDEKELPLEN